MIDKEKQAIIKVTGTFPDACKNNQYPALVQFVFYKPDGQEIMEKLPDFNWSETFGNYLYLGNRNQTGDFDILLKFAKPEDAIGFLYQQIPWGAPEVKINSFEFQDIEDDEEEKICKFNMNLDGCKLYTLVVEWKDNPAITKKCLLATFKFKNENSKKIEYKWSFSDLLDSEFLYIENFDKENKQAFLKFAPPPNAKTAEVSVIPWNNVSNFGELKIKINDYATVCKDGLCGIKDFESGCVKFSAEFAKFEQNIDDIRNIILQIIYMDENGNYIGFPVSSMDDSGLRGCFDIPDINGKYKTEILLSLPQQCAKLYWRIFSANAKDVISGEPVLTDVLVSLKIPAREMKIIQNNLKKCKFINHLNIDFTIIDSLFLEIKKALNINIKAKFKDYEDNILILPLFFNEKGQTVRPNTRSKQYTDTDIGLAIALDNHIDNINETIEIPNNGVYALVILGKASCLDKNVKINEFSYSLN